MSKSNLITYERQSTKRYNLRNHIIDTITIHCYVGQVTAKQGCDMFATTTRNASCNYVVGKDGSIGLCVDEAYGSWCSSDASNDRRAITIEVASDTTDPYKITDEAMSALINLCADICQRNNIKKLIWSTDKNTRVNHLNGCNMTVHRDYAAKACPGDYIYNKLGYIADEVNKKITPAPKPEPIKEKGDFDGMTDEQIKEYIRNMYIKYFGRVADAGGLDYWFKEIKNGKKLVDVENFFMFSDEGIEYELKEAYHNLLNREPDAEGFEYWKSEMKKGKTYSDLFNAIMSSDEYKNTH